MNKTQSKIIEAMKDIENIDGRLTADSTKIMEKLEGKGYTITQDTIDKHLKIMINKGVLSRIAEGRPWRYYYSRIK